MTILLIEIIIPQQYFYREDNCLPIVAFAPGDPATMTRIHEALMDQGIYIQFSKYRGSGNDGVLRIVVFSTHTKTQIDFLIDSLKKIITEQTQVSNK